MDTPLTEAETVEQHEWLAQLKESRARVLARIETIERSALREVADAEARLALILNPIPEDVVEHTRAAHTYARPYLERLLQHDPRHEVVVDSGHRYTPRRVLRRVLDHALDHLNQLEQWLIWQRQGIVPSPTDGWADSATNLEEDRVALPAADLAAWLWRIDLVVELLTQRAAQLRPEQLDWVPPGEGWSLRQMLHHLALAEVFYVVWLDAAFPEEDVERYREASQRLRERIRQILAMSGYETLLLPGREGEPTTIKQVVQEILQAEQKLLDGLDKK